VKFRRRFDSYLGSVEKIEYAVSWTEDDISIAFVDEDGDGVEFTFPPDEVQKLSDTLTLVLKEYFKLV
jgi:hypothetical protein